jgi:hypothetical protein
MRTNENALAMPHENRHEEPVSRELTPSERENLAVAWADIAVEGVEVPNGISKWDDDRLRAWLSETFRADTARLVREWGLEPDAALLAELRAEEDPARRADIEMRYIESVNAAITGFQRDEDARQTGERSTKWDSWPRRMRATRQFNCVGGTILGIELLNQAGIQSYEGSPAGHVVNIVRRSDGAWVYADFTNSCIRKLSPNVQVIGGVETLVVDDPTLTYRLIPLTANAEAPKSVLGNLNCCLGGGDPPESIDGAEAERIRSLYSTHFEKNDFGALADNLYPGQARYREAPEAQEERRRVGNIRKAERTIQSFFDTDGPTDREAIKREKRTRSLELRLYIRDGDEQVLAKLSEPLRRTLPALRGYLEELRVSDPETYETLMRTIR